MSCFDMMDKKKLRCYGWTLLDNKKWLKTLSITTTSSDTLRGLGNVF